MSLIPGSEYVICQQVREASPCLVCFRLCMPFLGLMHLLLLLASLRSQGRHSQESRWLFKGEGVCGHLCCSNGLLENHAPSAGSAAAGSEHPEPVCGNPAGKPSDDQAEASAHTVVVVGCAPSYVVSIPAYDLKRHCLESISQNLTLSRPVLKVG